MENNGGTVVINHHIMEGKQHQYENWLNEIGPLCRSFPGNIDWQIIRPIPHLTFNYTVIIRFDSIENLRRWMESDERKNLIEKAKPMFAKEMIITLRLDLISYFVPTMKSHKFRPDGSNTWSRGRLFTLYQSLSLYWYCHF
jgi:antibiotic biosynthesis monooxygenase (ABM) superfamily enzyme